MLDLRYFRCEPVAAPRVAFAVRSSRDNRTQAEADRFLERQQEAKVRFRQTKAKPL